jgi:hypothetical protein
VAAIDDIFDAEWLRTMYPKAVGGTAALRRRYQVLTASGPLPPNRIMARFIRLWRAQRAAWEAYLDAAAACSLVDDDLRGRLRDKDGPNFRGAIAECCACWLLAGRLCFDVVPRPPGRNGKNLDMRVTTERGTFDVEVKAPACEPPESGAWAGSDADLLVEALRKANTQFTDAEVNVLVLMPTLRTPICVEREQLVEAYIGQPAVTWEVPTTGDAEPSEARPTFLPNGKLVKLHHRPNHPNPLPDATRVSAIVSIEEWPIEKAAYRSRFTPEQIAEAGRRGDQDTIWTAMWEDAQSKFDLDNPTWMDHEVYVLHNPYAQKPLDESIFATYPQLVSRDDYMVWTDNVADAEAE